MLTDAGLTLVIATGHSLSLALFHGERLLADDDCAMATGQAEALMPAVAALLGGRRPARIVVEAGPGSFTGLRIGLAAATGLAIGWDARVEGVGSGALVAAPLAGQASAVWVALGAPRGQVWLEEVEPATGRTLTEAVSLRDPATVRLPAGATVAGPAAARLPGGMVLAEHAPRARDWHPRLDAAPASPRYVRPADHVGA